MTFSVVIPVYNVKEYLEKCIDSVLAQTSDDTEIILVDDGSTDGESDQICDRYAETNPDQIRVIHQENGGLGAARNTGFRAAEGEYVIFWDADDYFEPEALEAMYGKITEDVIRLEQETRKDRKWRGSFILEFDHDKPGHGISVFLYTGRDNSSGMFDQWRTDRFWIPSVQ